MPRTRLGAAMVPLALLAVLTGCSSGSGGAASSSANAGGPSPAPTPIRQQSATASGQAPGATAAYTIRIKGFMYAVPASVKAGSTLTVINDDNQTHTVTLQGSDKVTVPGGANKQLTAPSKAGSYPITCDFHGNMHATLVVV